jgi:bacterioferritin-associated ferredoxin
MYTCICNAIRETEVRQAACTVAGDAEAIYRSLGKEPQCRLCLEEADEIVADSRRRSCQLHFA